MAKKLPVPAKPANPILVAIDTSDVKLAKRLIADLDGVVGGMKFGLEFFCANGPVGICDVMTEDDATFFLDLKLHDIPTTVGDAVRAVLPLEARFLTVHCDGGTKMMEAAVRGANFDKQWKRPTLLGVTSLTSLEMSLSTVMARAKSAMQCGLDGIVCPPQAVAAVRDEVGAKCIIVVPAIRPASWTEADDQVDWMTPKQAIRAGADYLVIGRPITKARDPRQAAREILASIAD